MNMKKILFALLVALAPLGALAQTPQPITMPGDYTLASGPDNLQANLPAAIYPRLQAWATDRIGGQGYMVSDGTAWISSVGPSGSDGKTILNGSGSPPGGVGRIGDFYVDTTAVSLYGPKASGGWGSAVVLVGPTGAGGGNGRGVSSAAVNGSGHLILTLTDASTVDAGAVVGATGASGTNGVSPSFSIGTVSTLVAGSSATATVTGTTASPLLNLGIPQGAAGSNGVSPALSAGTITTLSPGASATASLTGTSASPILNLGLPQGVAGTNGSNGAAGVNSFSYPTSRTFAFATAYQATDPAKPSLVTCNVTSSANFSLAGGTTNSVDFVIGSSSAVAAGTGTVIGKYSNSNTGTIAVGLNQNTTQAAPATFFVPANGYFAARITAGSATLTTCFDQSVG